MFQMVPGSRILARAPDEIAASRNVLFISRKLIFMWPKYSSAGASFGRGSGAARAAMAAMLSATKSPAIGNFTDAGFCCNLRAS